MKPELYEELFEFQNLLQTIYFDQPQNLSFSQSILNLLEQSFGYTQSLMVCLANSGKKMLTQNLTLHNVPMDFAYALLTEYWNNEKIIQFEGDMLTVSRMPDYTRSPLYRKLLQPMHYKDCIIRFIRDAQQEYYVSCILLLSEKKPFLDRDIALMEKVGGCVSQAFNNNIRLWNLRNYNSMLLNCTNYYPIGIMTIENLNQVSFTNQVARQYLAELGVSDARFYSTFFVNEIYSHYHYNMMSYGANRPIRIKNFLFNVVATSNLAKNFAVEQLSSDTSQLASVDETLPSLQQISSCVYIICDDTYHTVLSSSTMQRFNLTRRESEVAEHLMAGMNNAEIATEMGISANTVKVHIYNIYAKAGVQTRSAFLNKVREASEQE